MKLSPTQFPWPHYVHEETKTVYAYIASGYPTVMALPRMVCKYFPDGYRGSLCTENFLHSLRKNEQKESS